MSFQEFLETYNGRYVDLDGAYGNQCMDLMHLYCVEVLGLSNRAILAAPAAKDVYNNFENLTGHDFFDKIPNSPEGIPEEGDIVLWGSGPYGHVAIYVDGDVNRFRSFDQNYPSNSPCHIQEHNYTSCLGWLRFKESTNATCQSQLDATRKERDRNWNYFTTLCDIMGIGHDFEQAKIELNKLVDMEDAFNEKTRQLEEAKQKITELEDKIVTLSFKQTEMISENQSLLARIEDQGKEISSLSTSLQELKDSVLPENLNGWKLISMGLSKLLFGR